MKILVYLPRPLGAAILAVPLLQLLKENFPASQISIVTNQKFDELFRIILPEYNQIPLPEIKDIPKLKIASSRIKKMDFDVGLLPEDSFASALLFYLARIPERWGYDHEGRGFMLTKRFAIKATDPQLHLKYYYLNILNKLGLKVEDRGLFFHLSEDYLAKTAERLKEVDLSLEKPIIAVKPGSSFGLARVWPIENQVQLINRFSTISAQVLLLGSPASQEISQKIAGQLDRQVVDLTGRLNLQEIPGVLAHSRVFLGNDSGLTHLANFLGIPVIGLYGPTDPQICGPVRQPSVVLKKPVPCAPCTYKTCPYDHRCLKNITVEEVFQAISTYL
jgi:heptosyltransferase-2